MTAPNSSPLVTIVIPVRNEASLIGRCLRSVFAADPIPGGMEVLVVDGMSRDGTREVLADFCRGESRLRMLDNPEGIVPTAMNTGIRAAKGQWIVRLDAHSEYPADYLRRCIETARRTGADNVGGSVITLSTNPGIQGKLVRALTSHRFGVGGSTFRIGGREGLVDTVPYGCYRREIFDRVGLYDQRLVRNQDYEFNCRLRKAGGKIWYSPAIRIHYYNQGSLPGLLRQAYGTGQWNPWMWYLAPYSFAWRHAVPFAFVTGMLGLLAMLLASWDFAVVGFTLILMPYLILAVMASLQQSRAHGKWMLPCLPPLFFVYHLAYGLGEFWGICCLLTGASPVQRVPEPWTGAGSFRAWPLRCQL